MAKAVEAKALRTGRLWADTTVVEANVAYPTDSGFWRRVLRKMARTVRRLQALGLRHPHQVRGPGSQRQESGPVDRREPPAA